MHVEEAATELTVPLRQRSEVQEVLRRPPKNWTDQRLRWIEPYWKGPELAAAIEKAYRLKPGAAGDGR